jgi:prophage regulatory protein
MRQNKSDRAQLDFIMRRDEVCRRTGMPASTLYRAMEENGFPRPIKLSERAVGWLVNEVEAWLAARAAERDKAGAR